MWHHPAIVTVCTCALVVSAGCGTDPEPAATAPPPAATTPAQPSTPAMPDTTADAVWAHLQQANYQSWPLWPGKEPMAAGTDPHGAWLNVYVNEMARDAVSNKAGAMPRGAMIVKENHGPDKQLTAVSVMYKGPDGYNANANNWFWLQRMANGDVKASGQVEMCESCHRSGTDYVRTDGLR